MQLIFERHVLDTNTRELRRDSEPVTVEPQVLDLLIYLIENRDRVVSRNDLIGSVWQGRNVSDSSLSSRIYAARKAIGDSGRDQKLIRTVARRGLRFIGTLETPPSGVAPTDEAGAARVEKSRSAEAALALPVSDRRVIAVLPFTNMSDDPEQEFFSDGISEDLITALSKLRWFLVIARNSSFSYKGKAVHIKQIGEELGARYVVEGSVRKSGGRVRVTAQLNDVASGSHVWADRYDREVTSIFSVQDEITEAIVSAIEPQLHAAENSRTRSKAPSSMDAWELVMRALSHYSRLTPQDHVTVREYLDKAIALDPRYCQALGVLSTSYTFSAHMGWIDADVAVPLAKDAALAAVRIDGEDPWAHHALGAVYLITRQFDDALSEIELALRLNPSFSHAQNYYATALAFAGRWEEAIEAVKRALRLSPRDPLLALNYGSASLAHYFGRNYEEAMRQAQTAIRLRADYASAHRVLVAAAAMSGQAEIAASALRALRRAQPNISCDWIATHVPIKLDADRAHYLDGFRRAGLE
ncbi:winged helix-turn-helix domain-containing tetratricopeptide repeat protein [Bradyrhizobium sp. AS23.2]|uniref:winged helix-turn-helix domain-containing tetratricopeptide repeat protein n=1 Tax=Bradyrhizobium sp. AS23.2 TaxID=1680155 RepID=UPI00093E8D21|nr:winged helix-turn-helix domain-containing tetratricopeptide repeat protein [Bradyrhizobium sp. AS23.2]OKO82872.1 membrane protein [Bradyrhizobium sp. AS23.2]